MRSSRPDLDFDPFGKAPAATKADDVDDHRAYRQYNRTNRQVKGGAVFVLCRRVRGERRAFHGNSASKIYTELRVPTACLKVA